jgi:hypothetical protein
MDTLYTDVQSEPKPQKIYGLKKTVDCETEMDINLVYARVNAKRHTPRGLE